MKNLEYELKQMVYYNRDGSYTTQAYRRKVLRRVARELHQLGYNQMRARSLKLKHVHALIQHWQNNGCSIGSQQQYLIHLRWWARKIGKDEMIPTSNLALLGGHRNRMPTASKAQYLSTSMLDQIPSSNMRLSIELQQEFGLRQEESLKFNASYADQGTYIKLKSSWTKGGRARSIPILSSEQRELIDRVRALVGRGSLIPKEYSFRQWKSKYLRMLGKFDFKNLHGLRHGYAQRRYRELTGWDSVFAGGPNRKQMAEEQRDCDVRARLQVSQELGHNRIEITDVYLGR